MQFDCAFRALIELAASRHNAFSTAEAAEVNFSPRRLRDAAARGDIRRLRPRVWAVTGLPCSSYQNLRSATLALPNSAATLRSAAWLHGWIDSSPTVPQVFATPKSTARLADAEVSRFVRIDPTIDIVETSHIRSLNKAATLCLLGASCSSDELEHCLDEFLRTESMGWLQATCDRLYTNRAPGPYALRNLMSDPARVPGLAESVMERTMARLLSVEGLPPLILQHAVEIDGRRFRLDLACPDLMLGVEFHSRTYHWGREKADADNVRDLLIGSLGWKVLYVTHRQIQAPEELVRRFRQTAVTRAAQLGVSLPSSADRTAS